MSARKAPAPEWARWLRANGHGLGVLTGTDWRVLAAIDACWQAYPSVDHPAAILRAVAELLPCCQEKVWPLARELIARALDWGDRDRLWKPTLDFAQRRANVVPNAGGAL